MPRGATITDTQTRSPKTASASEHAKNSSKLVSKGRLLIKRDCSAIAGCRKRRFCGDWTTKSSLEQRSISSWVCFPILVQPRDQPLLLMDNRNNGGSDVRRWRCHVGGNNFITPW